MSTAVSFRVASRLPRPAVLTGIGLASALTAAATANPVDGRYFDLSSCDNHGMRFATEELGTGPLFPTDERIVAASTFTSMSACVESDDPNIPNRVVQIINTTPTAWRELFYVGDAQTLFSNVDGIASTDEAPPPNSLATFAFKIDSQGDNRPLFFESMNPDGIFEVGEAWLFIVQDYSNSLGADPANFGSLDFSGGSLNSSSAASIVQFIPSPGSSALLALAGIGALRRRR